MAIIDVTHTKLYTIKLHTAAKNIGASLNSAVD